MAGSQGTKSAPTAGGNSGSAGGETMKPPETPTAAAEPVIETRPQPVRVERREITDAVSGALIALGHDAGDVGDLVTVAAVDGVMGVLQRRDLADTDEAAPKLASFRALTGRHSSRR